MYFRICLLLGLALFVSACDASTAANSSGGTVETAHKATSNANAFEGAVPIGWRLQKGRITNIDINGDGYKDVILTLIEDEKMQKGEIEDSDIEERAMLVLLGDKGGKYHVNSFAKNVLLCASCAGMMGAIGSEEPGVMLYDKNVLTINWMAGSRDMVEAELQFKFDSKLNQFVLISDKIVKTDRNTGKNTDTIRDFTAGTKTVNGKTTKLEKKTVTIESVKYSDYLGYK